MKALTVFVIIFLLLSFTFKKKAHFIPPGTVQITEHFFADECEISNQSWQEYEIWHKNFYGALSKEHLATLPDTMVWREKLAYNEPFVGFYYRHPAYKQYPVVGITYEQAVAFCKWRTERVKQFYAIRYKKTLEIEYRLPTKTEWENLCSDSYRAKPFDAKTKTIYYNLRIPEGDTLTWMINSNAEVTSPCKSNNKNAFGLYQLIGNVAEMTNEKGICKGGSWRHKSEDAMPGKDITYKDAASWLGFRCVCTLKAN